MTNELSSDTLGFERCFRGGALSRLHCVATETLFMENVSVCVSVE